jgi:hypothetical protein
MTTISKVTLQRSENPAWYTMTLNVSFSDGLYNSMKDLDSKQMLEEIAESLLLLSEQKFYDTKED